MVFGRFFQASATEPETFLLDFLFRASGSVYEVSYPCEGGIEKSFRRITVCHHKACRVMTNGDPEGRIVQSHPPMNNRFFFLLTI